MLEVVKDTLKQPYWVIALALGVVLVVLPSVAINEDHSWSTHSPTPMILVWIGIGLLDTVRSGFLGDASSRACDRGGWSGRWARRWLG